MTIIAGTGFEPVQSAYEADNLPLVDPAIINVCHQDSSHASRGPLLVTMDGVRLELTGAEANGFTDRTATSYGLPILE